MGVHLLDVGVLKDGSGGEEGVGETYCSTRLG